MSSASNPGLVGLQYSNPLLSSLSFILFGPVDPRQTVLFRNRRLNACDVLTISCSLQTAFHGNDTPFEMYSELKVSKSTGDF
jgi:hypothetical protein